MTTVKQILIEVIGEYNPIGNGEHFAGIDFQWLACCAVLCVSLVCSFALLRSAVRR